MPADVQARLMPLSTTPSEPPSNTIAITSINQATNPQPAIHLLVLCDLFRSLCSAGMDLDPTGKPFPPLKNDCILKAANRERTPYVPVWVMRQAGRYLPEFRGLRSQYPFFEICQRPDLACQVTLMPLRRFDLDAAIIFSDILVIPQALGMNVEMVKGEGPKFSKPLDVNTPLSSQLKMGLDIRTSLDYVYKAITLTRHTLDGKCPLIGFTGAPWTLMCYMIEGGGSKTMSNAKKVLYQNPAKARELLEVLTYKVIDHLIGQVLGGAQMLQIFESTAEYLTPALFKEFSLWYIVKICQTVKGYFKNDLNGINIPIVVFAKGAHYAFDDLAQHRDVIDVISLDWTMDPHLARYSTELCLQGNLDPCALYGTPENVAFLTEQMIKSFGTQKYIANLGHGIYPDAKIECVSAFVDSVHKISTKYNEL